MSVSVKPEASLYAVVYDLSCDRERRRLDKLLCGYGFRVQYSVFECHLTVAHKQTLFHRIGLLGLKTGHVRVYAVHSDAKVKMFGAVQPGPDDGFAYMV